MPRVLILIDWYLPGYKAGGPIQSTSNIVQALGEKVDFEVATLNVDHTSDVPYPDVQADQWNTRTEGTRVFYFSKAGISYHGLKTLIQEGNYDFLYVNSMYSLPFTIWPWLMVLRGQVKAKIVLAPRGMLQAGAVQIRSLKKKVFLALMRATGVQRKIRWQATDEQEQEDIRKFFGKKLDIHISPNIPKQQQLPWEATPKKTGVARFAFSSRVSRKKNLEFFLQRLHNIQGQVVFDIYGPKEDDAYWQLVSEEITRLPVNVKAQLKGPVPAPELPQVLRQYHFSVLTTHAENFGHSIFEGLLAGLPVVISDRTPWLGLEEKQIGWDIPLEEPERFEVAIQRAIDMGQDEYSQWSKAAHAFAATYKKAPELREKALRLFEK